MRNANDTDTLTLNPIAARDLLLEEPSGFVVESTIRQLLDRGWPAGVIMAEIPGVTAHAIAVAQAQRAA